MLNASKEILDLPRSSLGGHQFKRNAVVQAYLRRTKPLSSRSSIAEYRRSKRKQVGCSKQPISLTCRQPDIRSRSATTDRLGTDTERRADLPVVQFHSGLDFVDRAGRQALLDKRGNVRVLGKVVGLMRRF